MASSKNSSLQIYHEKEVRNQPERMLLVGEKYGHFLVTCNKALGNCLLQQPYYTKNIKVKLDSIQLENTFKRLRLSKYFKLQEIDTWLDSNKADLLGSILALNHALSLINIFLSPVDNMTYTSLVEKPQGFICLLDEGWIAIRIIGGKWHLFDPRTFLAKKLSDTYLDLIIKQLLINDQPVFRVSGCGFTVIKTVTPLVTSNPAIKGKLPKLNDQASCTNTGLNNEPKPTDQKSLYLEPQIFTSTTDRDLLVWQIMEISELNLGPNTSRRQQTRIETHNRSRSACRSQQWIQTTSNQRNSDSSNQILSLDNEWPPLQQEWNLARRKKRAKSTPRHINQKQNQVYHPPQAGTSSGQKESKITLKNYRPSSSKKGSEDSSCCICLDSYPDYVLYPCGHQCICGQCKNSFKKNFQKCPICKKNVADVIKIFKT